MSTTRAALEAALEANPDDVVAHHAYADLLTEEGDPRGEFIRLQLMLEDESLKASQRKEIEKRLTDLSWKYESGWLGALYEYTRPLEGYGEPDVRFVFRRGWLDRLEVRALTGQILRALATVPTGRLLRELSIFANVWDEIRTDRPTPRAYQELFLLVISPNIRNLRRLELGSVDSWQLCSFDDDVGDLISRTPRLETLSIAARQIIPAETLAATLPEMRFLSITTNNDRIPFALLGSNRSLGKLEHLTLDLIRFRPESGEPEHDREPIYPDELRTFFRSPHLTGLRHLALRLPGFGDAGVEELVTSPMLDRLRGLDLSQCDITDEGAFLLAAHPAVRRLESLHLDRNLLSPIGIDALAAVGVRVSERQYFVRGWTDEDELMEDSDLA